VSHVKFVNVKKRYGADAASPWAVNGVSFEIPKGTLTTLLGPSGCGKTTTLRMIAGLEFANEGQVWMGGENVTHLGPAQRSVSMMFQSYALFPHLNVLDNVIYGLRMSGVPKAQAVQRAMQTLANVGLTSMESRWPSELSGGQQQRVALARALVLEPSVLLFDEPLSNLDARLRREMREEIRDIQQRLGLTVAYVTHDQSEALAVSDHVIVMNQGRIAQQGTPRELYDHPNSHFVANFMGEAVIVKAEVQTDGRHVSLGALTWLSPHVLTPGQIDLAIRPEAWRISDANTGLVAKVLKQSFLGNMYEITLACEFGRLWLQMSTRETPPKVGETIGLKLSDSGVIALPGGVKTVIEEVANATTSVV
jgi:iron(III) transport system ATP-binding protein